MTPRVLLGSLMLAVALTGCGSPAPESTGTSGAGASADTVECPPVEGSSDRVTRFSAPPPMCIDPKKTYTANVVTDAGAFTITLDAAKAPTTVNNFVVLSRYHFYDGVVFHRVIKGFMAQGGDPEGTGSGGPGYEFKDELPQAGQYTVGSVAMANAGPNTNGSQFFIVTGDKGVSLQPDYSLFGQVSEGMETVRAIEADGTTGEGRPTKIHSITSVTITESP